MSPWGTDHIFTSRRGGRRLASEDSDELVAGLPPVHRLCDLRNLDHPVGRQMVAFAHQLDAPSEFLEIMSLRRPKRIPEEERDHRLHQRASIGNDVLTEVLTVVVMPLVDHETADAEEPLEFLQTSDATDPLRHGKPMRHLIAGHVALAVCSAWLPSEADGKASFGVYETDDPTTELAQPFLLIIRTRHIVTTVPVVSDGTDE